MCGKPIRYKNNVLLWFWNLNQFALLPVALTYAVLMHHALKQLTKTGFYSFHQLNLVRFKTATLCKILSFGPVTVYSPRHFPAGLVQNNKLNISEQRPTHSKIIKKAINTFWIIIYPHPILTFFVIRVSLF